MKINTLSSLTALCLVGLIGCSTPSKDERFDAMTASELYQDGLKKAKSKKYIEAVEHFEALEARYPFGEYAEKAKLAEIYGFYKSDDWPSSQASAERFIKVHPRHQHVDYAYYMKGLTHFSESLGTYSRYLPMERADRDVSAIRESYDAFEELISRFPNSEYAPDAKKRIVYLRNVIAENELVAARYYMERKAYVAAANRTKEILVHLDQSPVMEEALYIQAKAYQMLGLKDLSQDTKHILTLNYPQSSFLNKLS